MQLPIYFFGDNHFSPTPSLSNDKKIKTIAKWQEEKIKDTYIKITGEYRDCEYTNNWLKK